MSDSLVEVEGLTAVARSVHTQIFLKFHENPPRNMAYDYLMDYFEDSGVALMEPYNRKFRVGCCMIICVWCWLCLCCSCWFTLCGYICFGGGSSSSSSDSDGHHRRHHGGGDSDGGGGDDRDSIRDSNDSRVWAQTGRSPSASSSRLSYVGPQLATVLLVNRQRLVAAQEDFMYLFFRAETRAE